MAHLPRLNPTLKESKAVGEVSSLVFVFETIQVLTVFMRDLCHCCLSEGPLGKLSSGSLRDGYCLFGSEGCVCCSHNISAASCQSVCLGLLAFSQVSGLKFGLAVSKELVAPG